MQKIGRYEIVTELGRGAMGVVYSAMDPLIGRRVAIKTIRLDTMEAAENREELTRRLFREAQSAGVLSHPGIITIHDVGEQGNEAYIVMEYVDGRNLEDVLASGVPQHSGTLLSILRQSATALDYAHGKGIIHRDIKPANIMLCHDGVAKIADFGVAKLAASASMTQAGLVLGTPSYMSPEQAQGQAVDGRSDQFSLAVVAYRMLTGELPFQGATLTAILTKILLEEPQYDSSGLHPYLQIIFQESPRKKPAIPFSELHGFRAGPRRRLFSVQSRNGRRQTCFGRAGIQARSCKCCRSSRCSIGRKPSFSGLDSSFRRDRCNREGRNISRGSRGFAVFGNACGGRGKIFRFIRSVFRVGRKRPGAETKIQGHAVGGEPGGYSSGRDRILCDKDDSKAIAAKNSGRRRFLECRGCHRRRGGAELWGGNREKQTGAWHAFAADAGRRKGGFIQTGIIGSRRSSSRNGGNIKTNAISRCTQISEV